MFLCRILELPPAPASIITSSPLKSTMKHAASSEREILGPPIKYTPSVMISTLPIFQRPIIMPSVFSYFARILDPLAPRILYISSLPPCFHHHSFLEKFRCLGLAAFYSFLQFDTSGFNAYVT